MPNGWFRGIGTSRAATFREVPAEHLSLAEIILIQASQVSPHARE